jgi:hypothetical protein
VIPDSLLGSEALGSQCAKSDMHRYLARFPRHASTAVRDDLGVAREDLVTVEIRVLFTRECMLSLPQATLAPNHVSKAVQNLLSLTTSS